MNLSEDHVFKSRSTDIYFCIFCTQKASLQLSAYLRTVLSLAGGEHCPETVSEM